MNLRQLESFLLVAEYRSYVRAARQLFISQPAITQQIQSLESFLGIKLLERDRHNVSLTPAGERFYQGAQQMLEIYNQTAADCLRLSKGKLHISICYTGTDHMHILPKVLSPFTELFPECEIQTSRVSITQIPSLFLSSDAPLLLTTFDTIEPYPEIRFSPLFEDTPYCTMNVRHPLAAHKKLTFHDLKNETLLLPAKNVCPPHMQRLLAELSHALPDVSSKHGMLLDNAVLNMLSSNSVAIIPGHTRPFHPDLVCIPLDTSVHVTYVIAYSRALSETELSFISSAQKTLKQKESAV